MVFQDYALYPHMTVRDNIAYPLKVKGMHRAAASGRGRVGRRQPLAVTADGAAARAVVGWAAAACRPRQGDRHPTRRLPVRRTAVEPRRPAAPGSPQLPQAAAARAGDHGGLRHPRPERGTGARRPDGGHGVGHHPAGRHAFGALPPAGQRLRRRVHRVDADESDPRDGHADPGSSSTAASSPSTSSPTAGTRGRLLRRPSGVREARPERPAAAAPSRSPRTSAPSSSSPSMSAATQIRATVDEGSEPQPGDPVGISPATRRVLLYDRESGDAAVTVMP